MALHFPNPSRSYDAAKHCVRFWGHDEAFEIPFFVEEAALYRLNRATQQDEATCLRLFDVHRERVHQAADKAYTRRRRQGSYLLKAADF